MIKLNDFPIVDEQSLRLECKLVTTQEEALETKDLIMEQFPIDGAYAVAAPQIGLSVRAFVVKLPSTGQYVFFCNPTITDKYDESEFKGEGCLSFPGKHKLTKRYEYVHMEYTDENMQKHRVAAEGLEAVILQHEVDHLNGILYKDHVIDLTIRVKHKVGRNETCPCKSGKKYKKCCLMEEN